MSPGSIIGRYYLLYKLTENVKTLFNDDQIIWKVFFLNVIKNKNQS